MRAWPSIAPVFLLSGLAVLWETGVRQRGIPAYLLPRPTQVLEELAGQPRFYFAQTALTLEEALAGFLVAAAAAFVAGSLMAHSPALEQSLMPLALLTKVTPIVTVAPLLVLWFGFGLLPKVVIAALIAFFPVLIGTLVGLRAVPAPALEFLHSLAATPWQVFLKLRLPQALPHLFAGLRVALPLSLIGAVVAEWVGAEAGLGHLILAANHRLDTPAVFAGIFLLALSGILLTTLLVAFERRLLFWRRALPEL